MAGSRLRWLNKVGTVTVGQRITRGTGRTVLRSLQLPVGCNSAGMMRRMQAQVRALGSEGVVAGS